jgi:hypothetical protein
MTTKELLGTKIERIRLLRTTTTNSLYQCRVPFLFVPGNMLCLYRAGPGGVHFCFKRGTFLFVPMQSAEHSLVQSAVYGGTFLFVPARGTFLVCTGIHLFVCTGAGGRSVGTKIKKKFKGIYVDTKLTV